MGNPMFGGCPYQAEDGYNDRNRFPHGHLLIGEIENGLRYPFGVYTKEESDARYAAKQTEADLAALNDAVESKADESELDDIRARLDALEYNVHWLLCEQKIIDRNITVTDVAWYITPIINASGRMGVPSKAVNFFKSADTAEVERLGNELLSLNKQRKKQGEDYWGLLTHSAKESFEEFSSSLVFTGGKGVPRGITGILASKFSGYYNAPAIIYTVMEDKVIGSVRSIRNYSIMPLLDYCKEVFLDYGGHDFAGGFSLISSNLDMFKKKVNSYVEEVGIDIPEKPYPEIDAELPKGYLTEDILDVAQRLNPYGESNPPLVFLAKKLVIKTLDIVGQKEVGHIRFSLDAGKNIWPAIYWNSSDRAGRDLNVGDTVDAIFRVDYNYFRNKSTPQLVIIDMEKSPK